MIAPFIKPISNSGTFYTFPSAYEDLSFSLVNDSRKFKFSKYALINIPPQLSATNNENFVQLGSIQGAFDNITGTNRNKEWAESLQNYAMNFESLVISDKNYDSNSLKTVSEYVFWKWMKEIGAIRWNVAGNLSNLSTKTFIEEPDSATYLKVVQYLGTIDVTNNLKNNANSYSEIYIYVPSLQGNTPYTLFKTVDTDNNYTENKVWQNISEDALNNNLIHGRKLGEIHPGTLNFTGHWDSELLTPSYTITTNFSPGSPFPSNAANSFFTGSSTDASNDIVNINDGSKSYTKKRNRLDCVNIDWNESSYKNIKNNFREWSESSESSDYSFNAILLYYDIEDHLGNIETNLYGIQFLDKWTSISGNGAIIPSVRKYKPSTVNEQGGNSYGFKINLKLDSNLLSTQATTNVNEYNNMSMSIFMDAVNDLKNAGLYLQSEIKNTIENKKVISDLILLLQNYLSGNDIENRLSTIESTLNASKAIFSSNASVLNLINKLNTDIKNIYSGNTSVQMTYDLAPFKSGIGNTLDKTGQSLKYNINSIVNPSVYFINDTNFTVFPTYLSISKELLEGNNEWRFKFANDIDRNIKIYIDTTNFKLVNGQKINFNFKNVALSNSYGNFTIELFINNNVNLYTFSNIDFTSKDYIFDLICMDKDNYIFDIDLIKI